MFSFHSLVSLNRIMVVADSKNPNRFLLLYGTATGQAKAIAEEIAEKAPTYGLTADLFELDDIGKKVNSLPQSLKSCHAWVGDCWHVDYNFVPKSFQCLKLWLNSFSESIQVQ